MVVYRSRFLGRKPCQHKGQAVGFLMKLAEGHLPVQHLLLHPAQQVIAARQPLKVIAYLRQALLRDPFGGKRRPHIGDALLYVVSVFARGAVPPSCFLFSVSSHGTR